MAFALRVNEKVEEGIKRIILHQTRGAVAALMGREGTENSNAIHDIRVHFKKIRACLRLERDVLGEKVYRWQNLCFRNAARPLTRLRDAEILIETLDKLAVRDVSTVREALQTHYQKTYEQVLQREHAFKTILKIVGGARAHLKNLPVKQKNDEALLYNGLNRSYHRNQQIFDKARQHPTAENLHEWRKQAKYLWYQLLLLKPLCPKKIKIWDKHFHKLTQALGDANDLVILQRALTAEPKKFGKKNINELLNLIEHRHSQLQQLAFTLGARIYRDEPRVFARRITKHWKK